MGKPHSRPKVSATVDCGDFGGIGFIETQAFGHDTGGVEVIHAVYMGECR